MKKYYCFLLCLVFVFYSNVSSQDRLHKNKELKIFTYLNINEIKADEKFLASDELEGREMGEKGQKIAALYLKTQFEKIGLKSVNDSYYQKFKTLKIYPPKNSALTLKTSDGKTRDFELKKDFYPISSGVLHLSGTAGVSGLKDSNYNITGTTVEEISSKIIFVGYGITSPENNYDDYKNLDVKGKIVLIIANAPQESKFDGPFSGTKATPYKQYNNKLENALKHGAAGVLYMMEIGKRNLDIFLRSFGKLLDRSSYRLFKSEDEKSTPFAYITKNLADQILQNSGKTIDQLIKSIDSNLTTHSFETPNTIITLKPGVRREVIFTENVVGFLEGLDPELKKQTIVFSAHYDHLGIMPDGRIYNGADDDASGTTGILNIAKMFIKSKMSILRSLLFIAFTGEEKGLFGSTYYSENPLIPMDRTYMDLNIDMIGRIDNEYIEKGIKDYIYLIGPKIMGGDLLKLSEEANNESLHLKIDYKYDDTKDPNIFYRRSDHYNFAKFKIPTIFFFNGEHKDYHQVTDKVDKIDFDIFMKRIALIGYIGWKFANQREEIKTERSFP